MKTEDTVMTQRRFELLRAQYEREERTDSFECYSLKAQAGISFKAGEANVYDGAFIKGQSDGLATGRKQGIREVIEWGKETCPHNLGEGTQYYKRVCDECWQSKLREWGIDEETKGD